VDRQKSKNTKSYSFELFRLKERDVPIEVLEIPSPVLTFAWEPKGHRSAPFPSLFVPSRPVSSRPVPFFQAAGALGAPILHVSVPNVGGTTIVHRSRDTRGEGLEALRLAGG